MSQQVRTRPQTTLDYSSNNKISEQLSRGMVYRELMVRLTGQLTCTAANNTAAKTLKGDEWACVKRIDIVANNTDVLHSIKGADLWWLNFHMYKRGPAVSPTLGDASTLNPSFDTTLILPFWMPNSIRPIDTALDARVLSDLKAEVTWGTHTDINGDATGFTTAPQIKVYSLESFNVNGPFSKWRVFPIEKEITADNPQFQIDLPVGPMYRGFLINTTDAGADANDILNNFKIISGTTVFADLPGKVVQEHFNTRNGLVRSFSGTAYDDLRIGDANDLDGYYMYDHVTDGFLSEAIDTLGFSEFKLELDVSVGAGTTKVIVYPYQILPVRGQVKNA